MFPYLQHLSLNNHFHCIEPTHCTYINSEVQKRTIKGSSKFKKHHNALFFIHQWLSRINDPYMLLRHYNGIHIQLKCQKPMQRCDSMPFYIALDYQKTCVVHKGICVPFLCYLETKNHSRSSKPRFIFPISIE